MEKKGKKGVSLRRRALLSLRNVEHRQHSHPQCDPPYETIGSKDFWTLDKSYLFQYQILIILFGISYFVFVSRLVFALAAFEIPPLRP